MINALLWLPRNSVVNSHPLAEQVDLRHRNVRSSPCRVPRNSNDCPEVSCDKLPLALHARSVNTQTYDGPDTAPFFFGFFLPWTSPPTLRVDVTPLFAWAYVKVGTLTTNRFQARTRNNNVECQPVFCNIVCGVISPLLANIYLHWFEVLFYGRDGPATWAKAELIRYADDFVVLARYQGERLRDWIETTLEGRFGLTINREKTKVVHLQAVGGSGLDFLGFTLRYERSVFSGSDRYLHVGPSRKAMQRVRQKLRELTASRNCYKPASLVVAEVNRLLDGWSRYFGYGHPRRAFGQVNYHSITRMYIHLQRRSQRGSRPPGGRTLYSHLHHHLGLKFLRGDRR